MVLIRDVTGFRYGKLLALNFVGRNEQKAALWNFRCDCSNEVVKRLADVKNGNTKSCGCLQPEIAKSNKTHGKSKTRTYRIWRNMKSRCLNPNVAKYKDYGARGISICDRWLNSFENFLEDMGEAPINKSLDRINNNEGYNPENCRWGTPVQQANNQRIPRKNTSGYIGISFHKHSNRWVVQIRYQGKRLLYKCFKTIEEAVIARNEFIIKNNLPHKLNTLEPKN